MAWDLVFSGIWLTTRGTEGTEAPNCGVGESNGVLLRASAECGFFSFWRYAGVLVAFAGQTVEVSRNLGLGRRGSRPYRGVMGGLGGLRSCECGVRIDFSVGNV